MTKYLDQNGLAYFWTKIKAWLSSHAPVKYFGYNWNVDTNDDYALVVGNGADENNPSDSFKIMHSGDIVIGDGDSGSDESAIWYKSENRLAKAIRFITNHTDQNGDGIIIGDGGAVIIGSGESTSEVTTVPPSEEQTYIAADEGVVFLTDCNDAAKKRRNYIKTGTFCIRSLRNVGDTTMPSGSTVVIDNRIDSQDPSNHRHWSIYGAQYANKYGFHLAAVHANQSDWNQVFIGFDSNGNKTVSLTDAVPWRQALGLGTNGAFPLTIAQGGSGDTGVYRTDTVSNIITAASGITINSATILRWGKIACLYCSFKKNSNISVPANGNIANFSVGTLKSAWRPRFNIIIPQSTNDLESGINGIVYSGDGHVEISGFEGTGSARTIAANKDLDFFLMYHLA